MNLKEVEGIFKEIQRLQTERSELEDYQREVSEFCKHQKSNLTWQIEYLKNVLHEELVKEDRQGVKTPYGRANLSTSKKYAYDDARILKWAKRSDMLEEVSEVRVIHQKIRELLASGANVKGVTVEQEEGISVSLYQDSPKDVKERGTETASFVKPNDGRSLWGKILGEEVD